MFAAILFAGTQLLLSIHFANAQATVLVVVSGGAGSPTLSHVIGTAAAVQLQSEGLESTVVTTPTTEMSDTSDLLREGETKRVDFLLVLRQSRSSGGVAVDLRFFRVASGTALNQREESTVVDLNFDADVAQWVRVLTTEPSVWKVIEEVAAAKKVAREARSQQRKQTLRNAPKESTGAPEPRKNTSKAGHPATATAPNPPPSQGQSQSALGDHPQWGMTWNVGGAPMLLVGQSSLYFRYGAQVSTYVGVSFPFSKVQLDSGVVVGASQLFPAVDPSRGKVYAFRGGVETRLRSSNGLPVGVGVRLSGGAAAILAQPPSGPLEAKTDIFVEGGVSASLAITPVLVLGMKLGLLVVFENRYPIIAVTPAVEVGGGPSRGRKE